MMSAGPRSLRYRYSYGTHTNLFEKKLLLIKKKTLQNVVHNTEIDFLPENKKQCVFLKKLVIGYDTEKFILQKL